MPGTEAFTQPQLDEISRAVSAAAERSGLRFSLFVGPSDGADPRGFAVRLLAALGNAASGSVVIHVDPTVRRIEIATGHDAATRLTDHACGLAAESMVALLREGDLVAAALTGLRVLADAVFWQSAADYRAAITSSA